MLSVFFSQYPLFISTFLPILFLALFVFVVVLQRKPLSTWVGKKPFDARGALFLFIQLLIVGVGLDFITRALGINDTLAVGMAADNLALIPLAGIGLLVLSGIAEELFFRGVAYVFAGEFGSALLFAAFHIGYGSNVEVVGALLAGIILARGRTMYGSLLPGLAAHVLYNLVAVFVLP